MRKLKIVTALLVLASYSVGAQDIETARKAIDAEQYEKAKSMLKSILQSKPSNGRAAFLLGNIYLKQNIEDSAAIYFQKGVGAAEGGKLNYIGLGEIELNKGNVSAAQNNFNLALKDIKKKDTEELIFVARAYMNSDKPDFKSAIATLNKAKLANPTDAQVQLALGDAFYGDKNQNDAYVAYRNAHSTDNSLIRAKVQQAVLLKGARSFPEAAKALNDVIAQYPTYGPAYRELAETYYLWGNFEPRKYKDHIKKARENYEKYMTLSDYSLSNRMRHADFLILDKDYKALESEAEKMKQLDKVNPRILRYLGYSAYENGNVDVARKSLEDFISNPKNKVIARDYLYLGLSKIKKSSENAAQPDDKLFTEGVNDIKKSVEMELTMTNELSELGKKLFSEKRYKDAASIFDIAISNPESRNYNDDINYYAILVHTLNKNLESGKRDVAALKKADAGLALIISKFPEYRDAYFYKARISSLLDDGTAMIQSYEDYLKAVAAAGQQELTNPANKSKLIEAYNTTAANYATTNKAKAVEYFNKTLALDPANEYATNALKQLR